MTTGWHGMGSRERGSGMLLVLILGGVLSAIGLGLAALSATERGMVGNYQTGIQLLYAAEALAHRLTAELSVPELWPSALSGSSSSAFHDGAGVATTRWGEALDLAALTAARRAEAGAAGLEWQLYASGHFDALSGSPLVLPAYLIGWVADDEGDGDGNAVVDSNDVIVVRVEARAMGGLSRAVQAALKNVRVPEEPGGPTDPLVLHPPGVHVVSWREVR